ncbi:hypothetical protein ES705_44839 [subsurface metagenome]
MRKVINLGRWQLVVMLNHLEPQRIYPELKLPTEDEIKAMARDAYRKFYKARKDGVP